MSVEQENPNPSSSQGDELPDWLKEIRGEAPASDKKAAPVEPETPPDSVAEIEELPPWLQDVPQEIEVADAAPVETDAIETVADAEEGLTDGSAMWQQILAEEGLSLDDVPDDRPEGAQDMSVADYMEATADASAKRLAQAEKQPLNPAQPEEPVTASVDDGLNVNDELPDWLKDDAVAETKMETEAWLTDESVAVEASVQPSESVSTDADEIVDVEPSVPEWLQTETTEPAATVEDDGMVISDELPDWLKDETVAEANAEPETPSWMSDESIITSAEAVRAASAAPAEPVAEETEDANLPDWLRKDAEIEPEMEAEAPAWLVDETPSEEIVADVDEFVTALEEPEPQVDETLAEADLPDWLQEDADADEGLEAETPAWLADETVADVEETVESVSDVDVTDEGFVVEEELPDWLKAEVDMDDDETAEWLVEASAEEPETDLADTDEFLSDVDLPDWLQEGEEMWAETVDETAESASATTAAIDAEAPEWLAEETVTDDDTHVPAEVVEAVEPVTSEVAVAETPVKEPDAPVAVDTEPDAFAIAQKALEVGQLNEALDTFNPLIAESTNLDEIVAALSEHLNVFSDNPSIYEALGDAQSRLGQLNQAFQSYKTALQKL